MRVINPYVVHNRVNNMSATPLFGVLVVAVFLSQCQQGCCQAKYEPNWDSLDKRPLPEWYDEAKFGVFISWGLYAIPGFDNEWFWYNWETRKRPDVVKFMQDNYPPNFTYAKFASMFNAELFDPEQWADIIEASGAKYVTLITKHHSGYTNWPSNTSWNWNTVDTGPKMDLVGALAKSIKSRPDLHFGVYFSHFEWYHPLYLQDKDNGFKTQNYVREVSQPQLRELIMNYEPEVIYADGDWTPADYNYWNSTQFLAWLYNESPVKDTIVVNDRWGGVRCTHGDYFDCTDKWHPTELQHHKYESGITIDQGSWGYRRNTKLSDFLTTDELIWRLVSTVSCGGNFLANIGITADGRIIPIFEERLRQIGSWLSINGEAIYKTKPWTHQNDTLNQTVWYTYRPDTKVVYATLTQKYQFTLTLGNVRVSSDSKVSLLGYSGDVTWQKRTDGSLEITMPPLPLDCNLRWAWSFKLENVTPSTKPKKIA